MSNFSQSVEFFAIRHGDRAEDRGRNRDRQRLATHVGIFIERVLRMFSCLCFRLCFCPCFCTGFQRNPQIMKKLMCFFSAGLVSGDFFYLSPSLFPLPFQTWLEQHLVLQQSHLKLSEMDFLPSKFILSFKKYS